MGKIIPALGLQDLSDDELDQYSEDKTEKLTDNANFPTTDPTVASVILKNTNFRNKKAKAINGTPEDTIAKNNARKALVDSLTLLADDISRQSNGDLEMYASSGFDYKKQGAPINVLPAPLFFKIAFGDNEGQLKLSCKKVAGAKSYEFYLGTNSSDPKSWGLVATSSKTKVVVSDLTSGTKFYGRCRAVGARNTYGAWSDIGSKTCP